MVVSTGIMEMTAIKALCFVIGVYPNFFNIQCSGDYLRPTTGANLFNFGPMNPS